MTIRGAIDFVNQTFPNSLENTIKTTWLSQLDHQIVCEIMLLDPRILDHYVWEYDADRELILPHTYEQLYLRYLEAQLYLTYHEASDYQNTMQLFNSLWNSFACWYADQYNPAKNNQKTMFLLPKVKTQVQGETITVHFTLPYEEQNIQSLSLLICAQDEQLSFDLSDIEVEAEQATLVLPQETTLTMATGIWKFYVSGISTQGVRFESREPFVLRMIKTNFPEVMN